MSATAIPREFVQGCQNRDRTTIVFANGNIVCGKKHMAMPTYVDAREALTTLLQQKRRLQQEHTIMTRDIIQGCNVDSKSFDAIAMSISDTDTKIDTILVNIKQSPQQPPVNERAPTTPKERAQKFVADVEAMRRAKYMAALESGRFMKSDEVPTKKGVGATKPKIAKTSKPKAERKPISPTDKDDVDKVPTKKVPTKKPPVVMLSQADKDTVRKQIKDMLKEVFKFQDVNECTSKQRSKPFFTTKEAILQAIDANPDLKKLMPKNYKTLNKDQLCKHFYQ